MANGTLHAVIDVGSSRIKTLIGSIETDPAKTPSSRINVLGIGVTPSYGIRK